eukprot:gene9577-19902_t
MQNPHENIPFALNGLDPLFSSSNSNNSHTPLRHINLGDLVCVKGTLAYMGNEKFVVRIASVDIIYDPNMETHHWSACMYLHFTIYSEPYAHDNNDRNFSFFSTSTAMPCQLQCKCNISTSIKNELQYCCCIPSFDYNEDKSMFKFVLLEYLLQLEDAVKPPLTDLSVTCPLRISFKTLRY